MSKTVAIATISTQCGFRMARTELLQFYEKKVQYIGDWNAKILTDRNSAAMRQK